MKVLRNPGFNEGFEWVILESLLPTLESNF